MIDPQRETMITRCQAAKLLTPPGRKKMHEKSVYRQMMRGKRGVVLESVPYGAERMTSVEAVGRFLQRLQQPRRGRGDVGSEIKPLTLPSPKGRGVFSHELAAAELAAVGI